MILDIKIDTKDLSALSTLDYMYNDIDVFEVIYPEKEDYFQKLEKKKQLKPGDKINLTDYKRLYPNIVLTITHGEWSCILNGYEIPYSNIMLIEV